MGPEDVHLCPAMRARTSPQRAGSPGEYVCPEECLCALGEHADKPAVTAAHAGERGGGHICDDGSCCSGAPRRAIASRWEMRVVSRPWNGGRNAVNESIAGPCRARGSPARWWCRHPMPRSSRLNLTPLPFGTTKPSSPARRRWWWWWWCEGIARAAVSCELGIRPARIRRGWGLRALRGATSIGRGWSAAEMVAPRWQEAGLPAKTVMVVPSKVALADRDESGCRSRNERCAHLSARVRGSGGGANGWSVVPRRREGWLVLGSRLGRTSPLPTCPPGEGRVVDKWCRELHGGLVAPSVAI